MRETALEVEDCIFWGGGERGLRLGTWSLEKRLAPYLTRGRGVCYETLRRLRGTAYEYLERL